MKRSYIKRSMKPLKRKTKLKRFSPKGAIVRKCDKLFSLYIRNRDKVCQFPGCDKIKLHCAHIFSRRNRNLRWYSDNAVSLCYYHHLHWAHKEPILFTAFVKGWMGEERFNKLLLKKNLIETTDVSLVLIWLEGENEWRENALQEL